MRLPDKPFERLGAEIGFAARGRAAWNGGEAGGRRPGRAPSRREGSTGRRFYRSVGVLREHPHLARWFRAISERPATRRVYDGVEDVDTRPEKPAASRPGEIK